MHVHVLIDDQAGQPIPGYFSSNMVIVITKRKKSSKTNRENWEGEDTFKAKIFLHFNVNKS